MVSYPILSNGFITRNPTYPPNYLADKILFTKNLIRQYFYIVCFLPIEVNINTPIFCK